MKTNLELLTELIEFSPMMQGFIMTALDRYSENVLEHEYAPDGWPELLDWDSWRRCAQELHDELNKHLKH